MGQHLPVVSDHLAGADIPAELLENTLPAPGPQLLAPLRVPQQRIDGVRHGIGVPGGDGYAGIPHHLRQGAAVGGDHRHAAGHRLAGGQPETLIHRWHHGDRGLGVVLDHLLSADAADKPHSLGQPQAAHQLLGFAALPGFADHQQFQLRVAGQQPGVGPQQVAQPL